MNALHFPMPEQGLGSFKISTDSVAWEATKGAAGCVQEDNPPLADLRWGLAATTGAISWFHLDSNGFDTYIDSRAGSKLWIVGLTCGENPLFESISDFQTYFDGDYDEEDLNTSKFKLEAVLLPPGTRL